MARRSTTGPRGRVTRAAETAGALPARGTNVNLGIPDLDFLERRGARSHRGGSDFSRSSVLHRILQGYRALLEHHDPRRRLPPPVFAAAVALLAAARSLKPLEIEHLEQVVERVPGFAEAAAQAGVEPRALLDAVAALTFPEKFVLVDLAIQAHAPAAGQPG